MEKKITLKILDGSYGVGRMSAAAPIPSWADGAGFMSISRTDEELSIVCREERIPEAVQSDRGWRCFKFIGPFAFDDSGIMLAVIRPLSEDGIGVFVVSTFDGDHLLVKQEYLERTQILLQGAGHCLT